MQPFFPHEIPYFPVFLVKKMPFCLFMCYNHMSDLSQCLLEVTRVLLVFPALYRFTEPSLFCYRYFLLAFLLVSFIAYRYIRYY